MTTSNERSRQQLIMSGVALLLGVLLAGALVGSGQAHVNKDFDHLWDAHIKRKIAEPGTINSDGNPVDWTKLKGVPAGFADGGDYGIEGAGFGLKVVRPIGAKRYFTIEPDKVQKRVTGTCSAGAISAVKEDGTVTCSSGVAGPTIHSIYDVNTGQICNDACTEGALSDVPAGWWLILADITFECSEHCSDQSPQIYCVLSTGAVKPVATGHIGFGQDRIDAVPLSFHGVANLQEKSDVVLSCSDDGDHFGHADYSGSLLHLTAVQIGTAHYSEDWSNG